jgi:hypothetical protein
VFRQFANVCQLEYKLGLAEGDLVPTTGSCPWAWCSSMRATAITGLGRDDQAARVGRLTRGSSPIGAMLSRVM